MIYFMAGFFAGAVLCYVVTLDNLEVLKKDNELLWICLMRTVRMATFMESVKNVGTEVKK